MPSDTPPRVVSVAVPLIAVLLPEWMRGLKRKAVHQNDPPPKKVLVLVSGAGQRATATPSRATTRPRASAA